MSIGVIVPRRCEPDRPRPFKVPSYPVTPILSAAARLGRIAGLEMSNFLRLFIGLVVYFDCGIRHSHLAARGLD